MKVYIASASIFHFEQLCDPEWVIPCASMTLAQRLCGLDRDKRMYGQQDLGPGKLEWRRHTTCPMAITAEYGGAYYEIRASVLVECDEHLNVALQLLNRETTVGRTTRWESLKRYVSGIWNTARPWKRN